MGKKERLDVLLVEKGLFDTREKAKRNIMAGLVKVDDYVMDKPGTKISVGSKIEVKGEIHPFVSRGGLKLLKAIETFHLDLTNKVVMDIGASTGGFTDCSLQYGAKEIYSIDVGYGQLAWKLRQDSRVHVMERTNFRYVTKENLNSVPPEFVTIDVSFISLKIILNHLQTLLVPNGEVVALVKPQFEAGKEWVGKKGVIKDPNVHQRVLEGMISFVLESGYCIKGITHSPIKGGEGNIEFLLYLQLKKCSQSVDDFQEEVLKIVNDAHTSL